MQQTAVSGSLAAVRASLWMQEALDDDTSAPADPLTGSIRTDVCIVGGGYTGLWTALAIKDRDPSMDVVVIEANVCGAGASGVNGGFAMTWWPKWATLTKLVGTDAAAVATASADAVAKIGEFVARNGLEVDYSPAGWLWAATNPAQLGSWQETVDGWAQTGHKPYEAIDAGTAASMTGSATHIGGVFEQGVATLHPGRLVRSLRRIATERGIRLYENTRMTSLSSQAGTTSVATSRGSVVADSVVVATNAALIEYREIRRHLLALGSDVIATAPCPRLIEDWNPGLAVSDSRRLVHYYRTTRDGRVVFGKGGGRIGFGSRLNPRFWGPSDRAQQVSEQLRRTFPKLGGVPVTHAWSGAVDYSVDGMPFFGSLHKMPNVHYVAGFSGDGVGPSRLAGEVLASRVIGLDDEWSSFPLVRTPRGALPPEPARFVGGHLVRRALSRKERLEDDDRRPGRTLTAVAGLDPTSFVG